MDDTVNVRGDDLIEELVDRSGHEPRRGGLLGVNEKEYYEYHRGLPDSISRIERQHEERSSYYPARQPTGTGAGLVLAEAGCPDGSAASVNI